MAGNVFVALLIVAVLCMLRAAFSYKFKPNDIQWIPLGWAFVIGAVVVSTIFIK